MKTRVVQTNDPSTYLNYRVEYFGKSRFVDGEGWRLDSLFYCKWTAVRRARKLSKKPIGEPVVVWESI